MADPRRRLLPDEPDQDQEEGLQSHISTAISPQPSEHHLKRPAGPSLEGFEVTTTQLSPETTALHRIGRLTVTSLFASLIATLAIVGFLAFISFGGLDNQTWHLIMVRQWATRAISISTIALRTLVDLQASIAAAMIAALALESGSVRLRDAAAISIARAEAPSPLRLLWSTRLISTIKHASERLNVYMALLLCLTTISTQFSSTILLADLRLGQLQGLPSQNSTAYDFAYLANLSLVPIPGGWFVNWTVGNQYPKQGRTRTWLRNPPSLPSFAEYAEPVLHQQPEVDDTGVLLRAFLPFADAQSRENIRNYSGKALELDSRVSCQSPRLTNLSWSIIGYAYGPLVGTLAPTKQADRLWSPQEPIPFNCTFFQQEGATSVCQIQQQVERGKASGGLISEFSNVTETTMLDQLAREKGYVTWGTSMLIIEPTTGVDPHYNPANDSNLSVTEHESWTDIATQTGVPLARLSLCYAAWDTARLSVTMSSDQNRSEPIPRWNPTEGLHTTPDLSDQLGNSPGQSATARQIMVLENNGSWVTQPEDRTPINIQPWVQLFGDVADASFVPAGTAMTGNASAIMALGAQGYTPPSLIMDGMPEARSFFADDNVATFFHTFHKRSGSLARALSSTITLLSSMAYYDQMPRFQETAETTQVFFVTVLFPRSHSGFLSVAVVLLVHNILVAIVIQKFLSESQFTVLGNYWQAVRQLYTAQTRDLLLVGGELDDRRMDSRPKEAGRETEKFRFVGGMMEWEEEMVPLGGEDDSVRLASP